MCRLAAMAFNNNDLHFNAMVYETGFALTDAESECGIMLRRYGFLTAVLKVGVQAPSIQDGEGSYVIIPDIIAIDRKTRGWAFEIKDASKSKPHYRVVQNYDGQVWLLQPHKAESYLKFSKAFNIPCVIVIRTSQGWRVGVLAVKKDNTVTFNDQIVIEPAGGRYTNYVILVDRLIRMREFIDRLDSVRNEHGFSK